MTISLFDPAGGDAPAEGVARSRTGGRSFAELVAVATGDVVAIATANIELGDVDWEAVVDAFSNSSIEAAVLGTGTDDALGTTWSLLDPSLARAAHDPTRAGVIAVRTAAARGLEPDGDEDAWRILWRVDSDRLRYVPGRGDGVGDETFPALAPDTPRNAPRWLRSALEGTGDDAIGAGLLQMHDFLDESHTLAQNAGSVDGDYWHAIMHRREPDPSNSKYWFRRVGSHPVFDKLAAAAAPYADVLGLDPARWDPFAFVDACESARTKGRPHVDAAARRVQWIEMLLLLDHCSANTSH